MNAIRGKFHNGAVVFDTPPNWQEGQELLVIDPHDAPKPTPDEPDEFVMLTEEEQGTDPESVARWIEWYDSLEPLILTPEDEERIRKAREEQRAFELAQWEERSRKLERLFE